MKRKIFFLLLRVVDWKNDAGKHGVAASNRVVCVHYVFTFFEHV